ncbi:hypothetical protein J3459_019452 [Metarhizium acridum]|nr:hypothetical protein J3459_019452 [Metarhizium acridum]
MARELRAKRHNTGLILANGGMLTHQHALCLSARPRGDGRAYPTSNPLPEIVDGYSPRFTEAADGTATIETYTIEYNRDGTPGVGLIVGKTTRDRPAIPRQPRRRPNSVSAGDHRHRAYWKDWKGKNGRRRPETCSFSTQ